VLFVILILSLSKDEDDGPRLFRFHLVAVVVEVVEI
jgi:hypothetical protein